MGASSGCVERAKSSRTPSVDKEQSAKIYSRFPCQPGSRLLYQRRTTIPVQRITSNVGVWAYFSALLFSHSVIPQNPPASSPTKESILLTAEGKVETAPAGSTAWASAQTNQLLHVGDRLRTGLRSRATVRLS